MDKICGNCSGNHKFEDCPFVERKVTKKELTRLLGIEERLREGILEWKKQFNGKGVSYSECERWSDLIEIYGVSNWLDDKELSKT